MGGPVAAGEAKQNPMDQAFIYLASGSPRRRELLGQLGVRFEVRVTDVDETPLPDETPADMVMRLAVAKARSAAADLSDPALVLGADTTVVIDGAMLGKPRDRADGLRMLAALSGREHQVLTGVACVKESRVATRTNASVVRFREISADEASRYWDSGEPADKAGAYAIQGKGGMFVTRIEGSHSSIMGLPLADTATLLARFGFDLWPESEVVA